eukprot:COSAG01_NODE_6069_length_3871_cov_12.050106_2_plen_79_part_00
MSVSHSTTSPGAQRTAAAAVLLRSDSMFGSICRSAAWRLDSVPPLARRWMYTPNVGHPTLVDRRLTMSDPTTPREIQP